VMAGIAGVLARFKQPKHVAMVADLPRNAMGKVQKNVLRERYAGVFA
jgi:malonyl-CoA/methylmalonyl-CoA synthetase